MRVRRGPTCVTSKTVCPMRIDVMLLSPALQARMVASDLRWDTGIANHAYQEVTARAGRLPQVDRWKPAPAFPEVLLPALDTEELFARIFPRWSAQWDTAVGAGCAEGMWEVIAGVAGDFHNLRAGLEPGAPRKPGKVIKAKDFPPLNGADGEAGSQAVKGPLLRFRRLQCLVGLWGEGIGGLGYQGAKLLESLRREEEADSPFGPRLMALVSKEQAVALLAEAKAESHRVSKEQRRERTARWRDFCQDQAQEGSGRLFKWVRTGTAVFGLPSCPPNFVAEDGCPAPRSAVPYRGG